MTPLLWIMVWAGLTVLVYALQVVRDDDRGTKRVLVEHAQKLAHLDRSAREAAADRIVDRFYLMWSVLSAGALTGALALLWRVG